MHTIEACSSLLRFLVVVFMCFVIAEWILLGGWGYVAFDSEINKHNMVLVNLVLLISFHLVYNKNYYSHCKY